MAITVVLTETRPNTGVAFHEGSAEFLAFLKEAKDSGKIIESDENGFLDNEKLTRSYTFTFPIDEDYVPFRDSIKCVEYDKSRDDYNEKNNIEQTIDIT
tara:strand:+ start:183 stop:479 length:297 start_codon:yes stop_codon:yes gene_type:complete